MLLIHMCNSLNPYQPVSIILWYLLEFSKYSCARNVSKVTLIFFFSGIGIGCILCFLWCAIMRFVAGFMVWGSILILHCILGAGKENIFGPMPSARKFSSTSAKLLWHILIFFYSAKHVSVIFRFLSLKNWTHKFIWSIPSHNHINEFNTSNLIPNLF